MPAVQQLLFPDPCPLVERLGRDFFRSLPAAPGVYFLRDEAGTVLYVGKAKSLRQRLGAYRVANPGRMKRRHLRLLAEAVRIDIEPCEDEDTALAREAELILALRPRFNRAGTWPAPQRFVAWTIAGEHLLFAVSEQLGEGWTGVGPIGSGRARRLRAALVRLLWMAGRPKSGASEMPYGWFDGKFGAVAALPFDRIEEAATLLKDFASGAPKRLHVFLSSRIEQSAAAFEVERLADDLEALEKPCWIAITNGPPQKEKSRRPPPGQSKG